jgi:hypothetical protein
MLTSVLTCFLVLMAANSYADVRVDRRTVTKADIPGMPKDGRVNAQSTIVKGDRMMMLAEFSATLLDLKEEKVYTINLRRREYSVETFAALRELRGKVRTVADERERSESQAGRKSSEQDNRRLAAEEVERELQRRRTLERMREYMGDRQFARTPSGQRRNINGFDAQEVVTTLKIPASPQRPQGMVTTTTEWLANVPELAEIDAFQKRYASATGDHVRFGTFQPTDLDASDLPPETRQLVALLQPDSNVGDSVTGTAVLTIVAMGPAGETPTNADAPTKSTGRSVWGKLAREVGSIAVPAVRGVGTQTNDGPDRAPEMPRTTTQTEIVKISTVVSDAEVAVPGGFKEVASRNEPVGKR